MVAVPDAYFEDVYLASLYDLVEVHGGPDEQFYLQRAHQVDRVLDVGCGTGVMLHQLRDEGHRGRLVGLDPAGGMLARARRRSDVEWVHGYLPEQSFTDAFDLVYMTGHAFQVLLDDDAVLQLLGAVRRGLAAGGVFAFETRNPGARAWERWTSDRAEQILDHDGRAVRTWHELQAVDEGEQATTVTFAEAFAIAGETEPIISCSTLRFVTAQHLDMLLGRAGFEVIERHGWWDHAAVAPDSREIITVTGIAP